MRCLKKRDRRISSYASHSHLECHKSFGYSFEFESDAKVADQLTVDAYRPNGPKLSA